MFKRILPSGKIQYIEWYTDPMSGKQKQVTVSMKPTGKKSDDRIAHDAIQAKIRRFYVDADQPTAITLKDLKNKYVAYQQAHTKQQTAYAATMRLNTIIRLLGEDTYADRLTAAYISERLDAPPITYNERLTRLKAWIRWAYRMDLVQDISYLDKLTPKKADSVRVRDATKYLEHDEIRALLDGMKSERWRLLTEFLLLSGLRVGEAIALNDSDVGDVIRITKTYSIPISQVSTTKTETSTRDVDVQPELADCIHRIRKFVRTEQMQFGYRSSLFFPAFGGGYIQYAAYDKYFREHTERILGRRLTPHALRHTHTAMLAEAGVPLETISRRLGHADSAVTREVYMHVTDNMRKRDRERLQGVKIL